MNTDAKNRLIEVLDEKSLAKDYPFYVPSDRGEFPKYLTSLRINANSACFDIRLSRFPMGERGGSFFYGLIYGFVMTDKHAEKWLADHSEEISAFQRSIKHFKGNDYSIKNYDKEADIAIVNLLEELDEDLSNNYVYKFLESLKNYVEIVRVSDICPSVVDMSSDDFEDAMKDMSDEIGVEFMEYPTQEEVRKFFTQRIKDLK